MNVSWAALNSRDRHRSIANTQSRPMMVASGGVAVERGMEHGKIFPSPSAALPCQRVQWAKSTMTIAMTPTIGGRMPAMSRAKDFVFKNTTTAVAMEVVATRAVSS